MIDTRVSESVERAHIPHSLTGSTAASLVPNNYQFRLPDYWLEQPSQIRFLRAPTSYGHVANETPASNIGSDVITSSKIRASIHPVALHSICLYLGLTTCRERPASATFQVSPPNSLLYDCAVLDRSRWPNGGA
jgi:hypothetical protein